MYIGGILKKYLELLRNKLMNTFYNIPIDKPKNLENNFNCYYTSYQYY